MKKARMQIIFFLIGLISISASAQSKKRLDFNSYVQENYQILTHQKLDKNQLAFDELLPKAGTETTTNAPDFNNIKSNDSVWGSMPGGSNSQNQNSQQTQPTIQVPVPSPAPAAAPAAPGGENPNQ